MRNAGIETANQNVFCSPVESSTNFNLAVTCSSERSSCRRRRAFWRASRDITDHAIVTGRRDGILKSYEPSIAAEAVLLTASGFVDPEP